jgi:multidrug resistance efflux pump
LRLSLIQRISIAVGLVSLTALVGGAWWAWVWIHQQLVPLVESNLNQLLGRPIELGEVEQVGFDSIRFGVSAIPATPTDPDRITTEGVIVEFALLPLLLDRTLQLNVILEEANARVAERQAEYDRLRAGYRVEEIAQARARRDQLAALLEKLRAGPRPQEIAAAEAEWKLAVAELELADQKLQRTRALRAQNGATQEALDEAIAQWKVATARVAARKEQLDLLREGSRKEDIRQAEAQWQEADQACKLLEHGFRSEEIAQAEAALRAALAARDAIAQQLAELRITAPVSGTVEAIELRPGDLVPANATALTMLDRSTLWVRAYVPENRLNLQLGQELKISVDSFPGRTFRGHVTYVARQAEFTPGNVQTPEDRSQQVFRIKVSLSEGTDILRPGMAADVWLTE